MKFGYAFESQRANGFGQQNIAGQATFSFLETAVPGATSFTSGSSFASFLLGAADSGATETIRYLPQTFDYHGFYAQDDWHVNQKLTVNLGCGTNSRCRRWPAAISTRISRRPLRIRR